MDGWDVVFDFIDCCQYGKILCHLYKSLRHTDINKQKETSDLSEEIEILLIMLERKITKSNDHLSLRLSHIHISISRGIPLTLKRDTLCCSCTCHKDAVF